LLKVCDFRSKARIPVLTWKHPNNDASLVRCSQPHVGIQGARSDEDEKLFREILNTNSQSSTLYIFDARPKANAVANSLKGCGYENVDNYTDCKLQFLNIGNIHVMRDCYNKLRKTCFHKNVENPEVWERERRHLQWLENLALILKSAVEIALLLDSKTSIVVRCSDGWDRTPQLTSMAQLVLDPFYRTILGFQILIEKEWMSFGHKFQTRLGHGNKKISEQRAPIFVQFIDCVWQVTQQFPTIFEFNEGMLLKILNSLYSCEYGTFLMDSAFDRQVTARETSSLWHDINSQVSLYKNTNYSPTQSPVFNINTEVANIKLWTNYYLYWKKYHNEH